MDCIKQIKKNTDLVNETIPYGEFLVIDEQGNKIGILNRRDALKFAQEREFDIVVVSPDSKPMVAKLMDYSKYRYEQQRKLREMKKNQHVVDIKEIRLSPTIDKHDFETKVKHAIKFLEKGDKVKLSIRFFGRMITHSDVGMKVMERFMEAVGSMATIESRPKMDGRNMVALLAPNNNS
ncbi:MAG: translation initiation factor IF-3 [Acholeplasmataceae bacterium]|nr:translation initiation factor IF-3 [Acholeplasmataceae bacterium]